MSKRRGNGEGTIYQRKSDGKWCATITMADGKRRVAYADTFDEARRKRSELERQRELGLLVGTDRQTVAQFLNDWLEHTARPSVRPRTHANYGVFVRNHLIPALGKYPLAKLTPQHVQAFMSERLAAGYSPKTVREARAVLRMALACAAKWGIIGRNAAALVDAPKCERYQAATMTPDDARALLQAVQGDRLEALYVVAIYCGLREGEVLGLGWGDVDLQAGTLRVRATLGRTGGKLRLAEPKTERSRRVISLPEPVVEALREHRRRQLEERVQVADVWQDTGLVFTTSIGTAIEPRSLIRQWHRVRQRIGRDDLRFHDLRHGCATIWLAAGEHVKVVQELLGHHSVTMTVDLYGHVVPSAHREAAARIGRLLGGAAV